MLSRVALLLVIGLILFAAGYYLLHKPADVEPQIEVTVRTGITADVEVVRGAESWQFLAFVFAAVVALALTCLQDLYEWEASGVKRVVIKITSKIVLFALCFYVVMVNVWVRNQLLAFLGWLKVER